MATGLNSTKRLTYIVETTYGVTPTTPQMQVISHIDGQLDLDVDQLKSKMRTGDRKPAETVAGNRTATAEFSAEFQGDVLDPFLESALHGAFTGGVLTIGTTPKSFTIEEGLTNLPNSFRVGTGMLVDEMSFESDVDNFITASFSFKGKDVSAPAASIDPTPSAAPVKSSIKGCTAVVKDGATTIDTTNLKYTLKNNTAELRVMGNCGVKEVITGDVELEASATLVFDDGATAARFYNETSTTISIQFTDGTDTYLHELLNAKITKASPKYERDGAALVEISIAARDLRITKS